MQPDASDPRERRLALLRVGVLAATLAAVMAVTLGTGIRPSIDEVRDWGASLGWVGIAVWIPVMTALGCLLLPAPIMAGAAGLVFGTVLGTPLALTAATTTAVAQMSISRYVAGARVSALVPERARRIDAFLERRGFWAVFYQRLTPFIPYYLVHYGAGLTSLRLRDMAGGTALGALPQTFGYVALGGTLDDLTSPEAIAAVALLIVSAVVGAVVARRQIARERAAATADAG